MKEGKRSKNRHKSGLVEMVVKSAAAARSLRKKKDTNT